MRPVPFAVSLCFLAIAYAQDPGLAALHATSVTLHSHSAEATIETSGGRGELTVAKHQLRDWIETQLRSLKGTQQTEAFSAQINALLFPISVSKSVDEQSLLGSIGEVRFISEGGMLIVTTAVGILCQYDESAYAYKPVNGRWQRIWESEQTDYSPKKYAPQHIVAVHIWQAWKGGHQDGPPFVMTLGHHWGCASNWHPVYYRVWRADSPETKPLIDESESAFLRAEVFLVGSLHQDTIFKNSPVDALIEFAQRSIDAGVHNREAVRHYLIDGDQVRRVDPVALSPRDFVDEWLTRPWNESSTWSARDLREWHFKLHADYVDAEFGFPTMHCQTPDLWQVSLTPQNAAKDFESGPEIFFLLRWRPPFHFAMVEIGDKAWPQCNQEDREADEWRTLFSTQDWR